LTGRVGVVHGPLVVANGRDGIRHLGHRVVLVSGRTMAWCPSRCEVKPGNTFFRRLEKVCSFTGNGGREPTNFGNSFSGSGKKVGPVSNKPSGTVDASRFLVSKERQDNVTSWLLTRGV